MILNVFNRKELVVTFSMEKQAQIRNVLKQNQINYSLKVVNRNSPSPFGDSRSRIGTIGQNINLSYEYIFYVHKKDVQQANNLIQAYKK